MPDADYFLVATLGAVFGIADVVGLFRDAPLRAVRSASAWSHVAVNVVVSIVALIVIRAAGMPSGPPAVLAAGLAGTLVLRSTLTVKLGSHEGVLDISRPFRIFLGATERAVQRERGRQREEFMRRLMTGISFERSSEMLPILCFGLMPGITEKQQEELAETIGNIAAMESATDDFKAHLLGLGLLDLVGEGVLTAAVNDFRSQMERDTQDGAGEPPPSPPTGTGA